MSDIGASALLGLAIAVGVIAVAPDWPVQRWLALTLALTAAFYSAGHLLGAL